MPEVYGSIITARSQITDKEMVLGVAKREFENSTQANLGHMLSLCVGMGINRSWANEVLTQHMRCAYLSMDGKTLKHALGGIGVEGISHGKDIDEWRQGMRSNLPMCCPRCKSCPSISEVKCPILYGSPLEIQKIDNKVIVNEKPYNKLIINIGDGPLMSSFQLLSDNPNTAVIVIDPKAKYSPKMLDYALKNNGRLPLYTHDNDYPYVGRENMDRECAQQLNEAYRKNLFGCTERLGDLYLVNAILQSKALEIPANCADQVFFSYPTPGSKAANPVELIPDILRILVPGGNFWIRTEHLNYQTRMLIVEDQDNGISCRSGMFNEIPYSYYDYYLRRFPNYHIKDYCITKK
jgi:hypothetical protein